MGRGRYRPVAARRTGAHPPGSHHDARRLHRASLHWQFSRTDYQCLPRTEQRTARGCSEVPADPAVAVARWFRRPSNREEMKKEEIKKTRPTDQEGVAERPPPLELSEHKVRHCAFEVQIDHRDSSKIVGGMRAHR